MTKRNVMGYILDEIDRLGALHFTLLDPDPTKTSPESAGKVSRIAEEVGTSAIMVGGTTAFGILDDVVKSIKENVSIPVILFPGNVSGVSRYADAIFFMSLLNSRNPYWIIEAQVLSSFEIKSYGIEPISLGYIIVEPGGTAGFVGDVKPIPRKKPKLAAAYALAAQYIGFKMVYLEAGSGAPSRIPLSMVSAARKVIEIPLIVGGGIRTSDDARSVVKYGADIIVQGTFVEESALKDGGMKLKNVIDSVRDAGKERRGSS